ncbi:MAG: BrnT family toxin [Gammaproteobacteria bacterium]|nr:BrnT family toxin [Gammaproteobacteria bacterium]MBU1655295.1 BrnT family toxin [Gammaproteobacteria bacterium]MBU1960765.1 BrnT family toxin [Gammaproteobacteria bacterium]
MPPATLQRRDLPNVDGMQRHQMGLGTLERPGMRSHAERGNDQQLTGRVEGRIYVIVYTPRHDAMRIISARKANQPEVKQYENRSHDD